MSEVQATTDRREDSFLSSQGIDQSAVIMIAAALLVAFLLLSLFGRGQTNPETTVTEVPAVTEPAQPTADIAGSSEVSPQAQ